MNIETSLKLLNGELFAATSGGQATVADSRSADEWIKKWLDQRDERQNEMRQKLSRTFDPDIKGAYHLGKRVQQQDVKKIAEGGRWAVASVDGLYLSTHHKREDAERAANAKRYARVVDLEAEED